MPETCQRFGHYISEFRSLLDANQIHHGSPNDIFEFSEMLESSSEFRLDLSAMVKSVVQREDILLTDMMTIIVTSVGGSSFTDIHSSTITEPTKTLMEVLLGTGCWRQFGQYSPPPLSQQAAPSFKPPVRAKEPPHTPPSPPTPASPPTPDIPAATEEPENLTGLLDASNELRRMLTVLENNTEQVKRHLDSIEQRIHQIEPLPEVPPVQTPPPPAPLPQSESAEIVLNESVQPVAEETPAVVAEETRHDSSLLKRFPYSTQNFQPAAEPYFPSNPRSPRQTTSSLQPSLTPQKREGASFPLESSVLCWQSSPLSSSSLLRARTLRPASSAVLQPSPPCKHKSCHQGHRRFLHQMFPPQPTEP